MKHYPTFFWFFIILFIPIVSIEAQNDTKTDNSEYFDDDGIDNAKNIFKVNLLSIYHGDLPISYERIIGESFGIEIGAGVILPYYNPDLPLLLMKPETVEDFQPGLKNPDSGHSIWINPKYYFYNDGPDSRYGGLLFRSRKYNQGDEVFIQKDFIINSGTQFFVYKRLLMDIDYGVGFRIHSQKNIETNSFLVIVPINLKLGFIF